MSAQIIDGKAIAAEVRESIKQQVAQRVAAGKRPPGLAVIQVGEDPASKVYVGANGVAVRNAAFSPWRTICPLRPVRKNCWRFLMN